MLIPPDTSSPAHARNRLSLRPISFLRIVNQQMLLWTNARTLVSPAIPSDGASAGPQSYSNTNEGSHDSEGSGGRGKIREGRPSRRRDGKSFGSRGNLNRRAEDDLRHRIEHVAVAVVTRSVARGD